MRNTMNDKDIDEGRITEIEFDLKSFYVPQQS